MPFWYHISIPDLGETEVGHLRLLKWLIEEGAVVHAGTRLAVVGTKSAAFAILANGEGLFREKLFPSGAELHVGTSIGVIAADGESIPYGKPSSIAERLERG
jgi:pyruvate/2-oxoglutarate dehydrogenase complex dihydrolipoamide acyltransferase (E2) component